MEGKYKSCKSNVLGSISEMRRIFSKIVCVVDKGGSVEVKRGQDGNLKVYQVKKQTINLAD